MDSTPTPDIQPPNVAQPSTSFRPPSAWSLAERVLAICVLILLISFWFPWFNPGTLPITPWNVVKMQQIGKLALLLPILGVLLLVAIGYGKWVKILAWLTAAAAPLIAVCVRSILTDRIPLNTLGWAMIWVACLLPVLAGEARNSMRSQPKPGRFLRRKAGLVSHWFVLYEDFNTSTVDFYGAIEAEVKRRKLPIPDMAHITIAEGGSLSAKRDYLRFRHERIVMDLCAAPYGTDYFFSLRVCELPLRFGLLEFLLTIFGLFVAYHGSVQFLGTETGPAVLGGVVLAFAFLALIGVFRRELVNLDDALLQTPFIGMYYELMFRKKTYHRDDTRLMFLRALDLIVKRQVSDVVAGKGVKLGKQFEFSPLLGGDLYEQRPKELSLDLASPIQVTTDVPGT